MVKKAPDKSLLGKKPINGAMVKEKYGVRVNPSHIKNKLKRSEMYGKYLQQKQKIQRDQRLQRVKEAEALGQPVVKHAPHTIDNQREIEVTMVDVNDPEVLADEADDEFAAYFGSDAVRGPNDHDDNDDDDPDSSDQSPSNALAPKVLITTRPRPSQCLFYFIADLQKLIPGLHFYPRKEFSVKQICQFATNRNFTHLIVLSEKSKICNGLTISHLGASAPSGNDDNSTGRQGTLVGPTAFFKVSHVLTAKQIPNHGASTTHIPELNLHGFGTRLGHRVGRLLASLFPLQSPEFQGRQVVTFHNQRDYIFVRHHRYKFQQLDAAAAASKPSATPKQSSTPPPLDTTTAPTALSSAAADMKVKTRLQELGPRFTLKLKWLQQGTFDTVAGEYEFTHKRKEMDTSRRKFHL
jgi:ribosome production factor 1